MHTSGPPHLLLVEDDPVSAEFLRRALEAMPARVDAVPTLAQALARAQEASYDLWLIDARLPDGDGVELLAALRMRHPATPALAHTAEADGEARRALLDAGFADVLSKPLGAAELRGHVGRALALPRDWNDERALRALGGQAAHVRSLRDLFLKELPTVRTQARDAFARGDSVTLNGLLHRLKASCAFVGAERLGLAVDALHAAPGSDAALSEFLAAVEALAT